MPQNLAPFHPKHDENPKKTASKAGATLLLELIHATGIYESLESLSLHPYRGFRNGDHGVAAIYLDTLGDSCGDDLEYLRKDSVLGTLCRKMEEHFRIKNRARKAFPCSSAFRN